MTRYEIALKRFGIEITEQGFLNDKVSIRAGELFAAMDFYAASLGLPMLCEGCQVRQGHEHRCTGVCECTMKMCQEQQRR